MRRILGIGAGALFLCAAAFGETWSGTVVDAMCKAKDPASHTRECALGCAKSGFGIVTADGKFVKFDDAGNSKTVEALKASTKDKDLQAKVTGSLDGDTIKVESIELQ
jgi:hypothetical protein